MAATELRKNSSDLSSWACLSFFWTVESYQQLGTEGTRVEKHANPVGWERWAAMELATKLTIYQARG